MTHTRFVDARSSLHDCFRKRVPHQNAFIPLWPQQVMNKHNGSHEGIDRSHNWYVFSKDPKVNGTYVCVSCGLEGRTTLIVGRSLGALSWVCLASHQVVRPNWKPSWSNVGGPKIPVAHESSTLWMDSFGKAKVNMYVDVHCTFCVHICPHVIYTIHFWRVHWYLLPCGIQIGVPSYLEFSL